MTTRKISLRSPLSRFLALLFLFVLFSAVGKELVYRSKPVATNTNVLTAIGKAVPDLSPSPYVGGSDGQQLSFFNDDYAVWSGRPTPAFPMWVQNYSYTPNPMWGFVLVKSLEDVGTITNTMKRTLVGYGNYLDFSYPPKVLPIYAGKDGFWNPATKDYWGMTNTPEKFLVVVWLDDKK
jgi:hypothetical protein